MGRVKAKMCDEEGNKMRQIHKAAAKVTIGAVSLAVTLWSGTPTARSCTPLHHFPTTTPGYLTVVLGAYPPYDEIEDGKLSGVDGVILNTIAAEECLGVKIVQLPSASEIPEVIAGRADITIGDWYRSVPRARVAGLTYPLYVDQMALVSADGIDTIHDLKGKRVGSTEGFLWDTQLGNYLGPSFLLYPSDTNVYEALASGRIDVAVDGFGAAEYAVGRGHLPFKVTVVKPDPVVPASIEPAQAGWPYNKANVQLGTAFDADIQALHKNGRIAEILQEFELPASAADTGPPRLVGK